MVELKRHNILMNSFKNAVYEVDIERNVQNDEIVHEQVSLVIFPEEIRKIKEIQISQPSYLEGAKEEVLSNLYQIERKEDKIHYLTMITVDFIETIKPTYPIYKAVIIDGYYINNFESIDLNRGSIFYNYLSLSYSKYYPEWIDFLKRICLLYNLQLDIETCNLLIKEKIPLEIWNLCKVLFKI